MKLQITDAEIILDWLQARIDLNGCAPQHLHKTLIQLHVSTMSPCLDVQCQFPWGLLHFNLFIPTTTETRSKSKCKRINVNGKHALHMALFHKLLHYHTHTHSQSVVGHQPRRWFTKVIYSLWWNVKIAERETKTLKGLDASISV